MAIGSPDGATLMAPGKSPAFRFYANDFFQGTFMMSLQEVGAYIRLLCYEWDNGAIPNDPAERARIMGCAKGQEAALWKRVERKFTPTPDGYINDRLEEERRKQFEYRRRQSDRGMAGATQRWKHKDDNDNGASNGASIAKALPQPDDSLSFSSSSSSSKNNNEPPPTRPLISGEANPRTWGKIHGDHVSDFCDWVCLNEFLFNEFVRKSAGPEYVMGWARAVRQRFEGQVIGDNLKFWRARWSESHPEKVETSKPKLRPVAEIIAERERKTS